MKTCCFFFKLWDNRKLNFFLYFSLFSKSSKHDVLLNCTLDAYIILLTNVT